MRKLLSSLAMVVGIGAAACVGFSGVAAAQNYPPSGPTIGAVTSGGNITVTVDGFDAHSSVDLTGFSSPVALGTVSTDASGSGSLTFDACSVLGNGNHTITGDGTSNGDPTTASTSIGVSGCGSSSGSALAFTGSSGTGDLWRAGAVLLIVGIALTIVGFRRRASRSALNA